MKKKKLIPFAFLGSLLIIVIFIFGVQYGKKVAQIDKTIHFLISITPTKAITPSPAPSISYNSYENPACGFSFLYPSNVKKETNSSMSASFKDISGSNLQFTCEKNAILKNIDITKTATASVLIENKNLTASKSGDIYTFSLLGKKKQFIQFAVSSSLLPLVENTLKITK